MPPKRIPLACIFAVVCTVIVAGFVGVILLLTLNQREAFTKSIYEQIDLSQQKSNLTILSPLLEREKSIDFLAMKMRASPQRFVGGSYVQTHHITDFYNEIQLILSDRQVTRVFQLAETNISDGRGGTYLFNAIMLYWVEADLFIGGLGMNGTNVGFLSPQLTYPVLKEQLMPEMLIPGGDYDIRDDPTFSMIDMPEKSRWLPNIAFNPLTNDTIFDFAYSTPLLRDASGHVTSSLWLTMSIANLKEMIIEARASPETTIMLVDYTSDVMITSSDLGLLDYNVTGKALYSMRTLPNEKLAVMYAEAIERCPPSTCDFLRVERKDEILSSMSIKTPRIHLIVVQLTPREYFFNQWDKDLATGVGIGALAAALVLFACVALWLIIARNIATLQIAMQLSSEMRNDEAHSKSSKAPSLLSEVRAIQSAFEAMNNRLLLARPFLPQSLLVANLNFTSGGSSSETDNGSDEDNDGNLQKKTAAFVRISQKENSSRASTASEVNECPSRKGRMRRSSSRSTIVTVKASTSNGPPSVGVRIRNTNVLSNKRVAVVALNVRCFHAAVKRLGPEGSQQAHRALTGIVEARVGASRGIVDALHGDRFTLTFNVARPVASPSQTAVLAALGIVAECDTKGLLFGSAGRHPLTMGISCGRALVGSLGTDSIKKLCTVGPAFSEAVSLERVSRWVGTPIVLSDRAKAEAELAAHCYFLGMGVFPSLDGSSMKLPIPTQSRPHSYVSILSQPANKLGMKEKAGSAHNLPSADTNGLVLRSVYSAMRPLSSSNDGVGGGENDTKENDEWLYAMQAQQEASPFDRLETAMRLRCGDRSSAGPRRASKETFTNTTTPNDVGGGQGGSLPPATVFIEPRSPLMSDDESRDNALYMYEFNPTTEKVKREGSSSSVVVTKYKSGASGSEDILNVRVPSIAQIVGPTAEKRQGMPAPLSIEWAEARTARVLAMGEMPIYDLCR